MIVRDMRIRRHSVPDSVYGRASVSTPDMPVEPPKPVLPAPVDPWPDAPVGFSWSSLIDQQ